MAFEDRKFTETFRSLLLPIKDSEEKNALDTAFQLLIDSDIEEQDIPSFIRYELELWIEEGISPLLKRAITVAIASDGSPVDIDLSKKYFELHKALQSDGYLMTFDQSSAYLSHARLIISLSEGTKMTSSQIAKVMNARDQRVPFSRKSIDLFLSKLKLKSAINGEDFIVLYNTDSSQSEAVFADADLRECEQMIGDIAHRLCGDSSLIKGLRTLAPIDDLTRFIPYLQILHYQCSISEYLDYDIMDLYEFKPRGENEALFDMYPDSLVSAGNPFLNNAKSVERLTPEWVRSKKGKQSPGAAALYNVLDSLQSLGFSARRELSSWIRMWIHRVILIAASDPVALPKNLSDAQVVNLIAHVAAGNTGTSGVIEQRIVDAVAKAVHPNSAIWKARGLEESVNTTNTSRMKLGDCDFQSPATKVVNAYEAHAGKLTRIYLSEHERTLRKILPRRAQEWEAFSDVPGWSVKVLFVAHEIADDIAPVNFEIDGVDVTIETETFNNFLNSVAADQLKNTINQYVMNTLSRTRVPESVREEIRKIIS